MQSKNNTGGPQLKNHFLVFSFLIISLLINLTEASAIERDILKTTLDNGLTVILEEDHSAPVVALQMWVQVGSADEKPNEAGLSHVFEHMLFKGTSKRGVGVIAAEVDESGGNINAFTSTDNTVYHLVVSSRYFDKGLDILSDAIQNSTFDKVELSKELEVVLEELRMGKDNPTRAMFVELSKTAFKDHQYKNPVIGSEETVSSFTREDMLKFFDKWYIPNNMTLVITGDINNKSALAKIKKSFKDFKEKPSPHVKRTVEKKQKETRVSILTQPISKPQISFGFHIPALKHNDTYALDVLSEILASGVTSRFYKKVKKEKELVYSISAYAMTPKDPGLFSIYATLERDKIKEATKEIFDVLYKLKAEGPTNGEMDKAKLSLESDFVYGRETMEGKARQLGYYQTISGDIDFESQYIRGIGSVKKDDIIRVIGKYFTANNATFTAVIPNKAKRLKEKNVIKNIKNYIELADLKNQKAVDKSPSETVTKLKNGIKIIVEENHSNNTAAFYITFHGGVLYENENNNGIGNFMAGMLRRGTKEKSMLEIAEEVESVSGSLRGFSGKNSVGVTGKFLSKHFNKGLNLASEIILEPNFPDTEIDKLRHDVIASIKMQEDRLSSHTFKLLNKEFFNRHPYSMQTIGTIESVSALTRDDLIKHHSRLFNPKNMVITVVGDVETENIIKDITKLFGDMGKRKLPKTKYSKKKRKKGIVTVGDRKVKEQTHVALAFPGVSFKHRDKYAIDILTEVLAGMGGRLFVELRDKQSLAYSVTAFSQQGVDTGAINLYIGSAPDKKDAAIKGLLSELEKVITNGITANELKRAKRSIIGGYDIGLQSTMSKASNMSNNELQGLGFGYYKIYPKFIDKVTLKQVQKVAKKYLTLNSYVISVVGPNFDEVK